MVHFQIGSLVWSEPGADWGWVAGEAAAGGALWHQRSLGGKAVLEGETLGRCFCWFKWVFSSECLAIRWYTSGHGC